MQLQYVNPNTLTFDPANPRKQKVDPQSDKMLVANIKEIGLSQPPTVRLAGKKMVVKYGERRARAAISAGLSEIPVLVLDDSLATEDDQMRALSENLVRQPLNTVDLYRCISAMKSDRWTTEAIATALSLTARVIQRLELCAKIDPAILNYMAKNDEPNAADLRIIANADPKLQAEAWKQHRPRAGENFSWRYLANALAVKRIKKSLAAFDDTIAAKYGIVWQEDLFEQAGVDSLHTTQTEAFLAAQQEHMETTLKPKEQIVPLNQWGQPKLPPKASIVYGGKHPKGSFVGKYIDEHTTEIKTVCWTMPAAKLPPKKAGTSGTNGSDATELDETPLPVSTRAPVTADGVLMIGQFASDALSTALKTEPMTDLDIIAYLTLALAAENVTYNVRTTGEPKSEIRRSIKATLAPNLDVVADPDTIRAAARTALSQILNLSKENGGANSGAIAKMIGNRLNANNHIETMATEEFLKKTSKGEIERIATELGATVGKTGKETRAAVMRTAATTKFIHSFADFSITDEDRQTYTKTLVEVCRPNYGYTVPVDPETEDGSKIDESNTGGDEGDETTDETDAEPLDEAGDE